MRKATIWKPTAGKLKGRFKEKWEDWVIREVEER